MILYYLGRFVWAEKKASSVKMLAYAKSARIHVRESLLSEANTLLRRSRSAVFSSCPLLSLRFLLCASLSLWLALLLLSFASLIVLICKGFFVVCVLLLFFFFSFFLVEEILILYCFIFISRGTKEVRDMAAESREENVYIAKLAEQAERYDEMVEAMEKVAKTVDVGELTVEERNLLSVAYKNVIGPRRASWRIVSSIEQKEESKGNEEHVAVIKDYRAKVEQELSTICDSILKVLDTHLIPTSATGESRVFYLKMKGDYHRYLAEFKTGAERKEAAESTLLAYKSAQVRSLMFSAVRSVVCE